MGNSYSWVPKDLSEYVEDYISQMHPADPESVREGFRLALAKVNYTDLTLELEHLRNAQKTAIRYAEEINTLQKELKLANTKLNRVKEILLKAHKSCDGCADDCKDCGKSILHEALKVTTEVV